MKWLPYHIQTRWLRTSAEVEKLGLDPKFDTLVKFLKNESEIANSAFASAVNQRNKKGGSSFFTKSAIDKNEAGDSKSNRSYIKCVLCDQNHLLHNCKKFADLSMDDRIAFTRKNRLCDNCFKRGHIASFCRLDSACTVKECNRKHHKLLHREPAKSFTNESQSSKASGSITASATSGVYYAKNQSNRVFLNVVPMKVFCNSNKVETYAFLDRGSTTTLCNEKLLRQLGVVGEDVSFVIKTVNKMMENHQGMRTNLHIAGLNGDGLIELREVLSVRHLPIKANSSLTKEDLKRWPH